MITHERRMRLADGVAYRTISWEKFPSMIAWFALQEAAKSNRPTAEGGIMLDFPLTALAFYIHKVQVDKRVLNHIEAASNKNRFLHRIRANVFRAKDLKDFLNVLNSLG